MKFLKKKQIENLREVEKQGGYFVLPKLSYRLRHKFFNSIEISTSRIIECRPQQVTIVIEIFVW